MTKAARAMTERLTTKSMSVASVCVLHHVPTPDATSDVEEVTRVEKPRTKHQAKMSGTDQGYILSKAFNYKFYIELTISHKYFCELVDYKTIILEHVGTQKQLIDIFTKALNVTRFESLRTALRICIM